MRALWEEDLKTYEQTFARAIHQELTARGLTSDVEVVAPATVSDGPSKILYTFMPAVPRSRG